MNSVVFKKTTALAYESLRKFVFWWDLICEEGGSFKKTLLKSLQGKSIRKIHVRNVFYAHVHYCIQCRGRLKKANFPQSKDFHYPVTFYSIKSLE